MAIITQPRAAELRYSSLRAEKSPGDLVKIQVQEVWGGTDTALLTSSQERMTLHVWTPGAEGSVSLSR